MIKLPVVILTFICLSLTAKPADTDSMVMQDLSYLKKRINLLIYKINQMDNTTGEDIDSLRSLSYQSLNQLDRLSKKEQEHHQALNDTIQQKTNGIESLIHSMQNNLRQLPHTLILIHTLGILLILFLIFMIYRQRRRSIDYLVSQTLKISRQSDEITEKTNELQQIRYELEKNLKQQKKIRKRLKKKKK